MFLLPAFFLGLVGSLHCLGMCGPLAMALPIPVSSRSGFVLGRVAYNFGRLLTYCALGLLFGLIGKSLAVAGVQRWISILLGSLLLLGLFGAKKFRVAAPAAAAVNRLKASMGAMLKRRSYMSLSLLGMLNGLLPCGLVYVAAAGATATGGVLEGVFYMGAFGLATLPAMFTASLGVKWMPLSLRLKLHRVIPASVFVLAILLILRGMSLGVPYLSPDLAQESCCH